jgi:hypothetical protein
MIYIHKLIDLNPKSADIESTLIIREIKKKIKTLSEQQLQSDFSMFFMSETDHLAMDKALELVNPAIEEIKKIAEENNDLYEQLNLKRAVSVLLEMPEPLKKNIEYATEINRWKDELVRDLIYVLKSLPAAKTQQEKIDYNKRISDIMAKILRKQDAFAYNYQGIINEAEVEHITSLHTSMEQGSFFHFTLQEELKKLKFEQIRSRIPSQDLQRVEKIKNMVFDIKNGVDRAYENNMRMVNLAVIIYSYVKTVMGK